LNAFITGTGWVTAGGEGTGRNAAPFALSEGPLPGLAGKITFANQNFKRFGRMDRYCKLGLKAIAYALQDAGLDAWKEKRDIGVIVSTVLGCLATDFDYYNTVIPRDGLIADPNLFTYALSNSFIGYAAIIFGLTGKPAQGLPPLYQPWIAFPWGNAILFWQVSAMLSVRRIFPCPKNRRPDQYL
jgi:3-oxoacyl-(acyl-carrier-protein) synthase